MKTFIIEVTDDSKTEFAETLLNEIDGIVVKEKKEKPQKTKGKDDLFASTFGMWKDRHIDAKELRKKAWRNKE
jgi:hypothetical protein